MAAPRAAISESWWLPFQTEKLEKSRCYVKEKKKTTNQENQSAPLSTKEKTETGVVEANVIRKHMRRFKKVQKNMKKEMYKK